MNMHSLVRPTGLILLALGTLGGCDAPGDSFCTEQFVTVTAVVVDATGAPVVDAVVTSTLVRTGEILPPTTLALFTPGTYVIVDDGARSKLLPAGDSVRVDARRTGGPSTTADYLFDVPGGCHVNMLAGPDTLTVQ
jgi:hypothetical protein